MSRMITLQQMAEALGLNASTVSRALSNHPKIKAATRQLVQAKAAEMGYRPDPALRRLADRRWASRLPAKRTASLAVVQWAQPDYGLAEFKKPIEIMIRSLGYGCEQFFVSDYPDVESAARIMEARGVVGLIVLPSKDPDAWQNFLWEQFAAVQVMSGEELPTGLSMVNYDSFGTVLDAGLRVERARPASAAVCLLRQPRESATDLQDHAAALVVTEWWKRAGIACKAPQFFTVGPNSLRGMAQWLAKERVEAAIVPNPGVGVWRSDSGRRILPEEIRIIALNRQRQTAFAGYERQLNHIARRAVQYLDSLIRHDERGRPALPELISIPSLWVPGASFPE
ncbi:MAG: LacI family DNA-binding transcriptional regulator [Kiritimatiellaceae bacterium]|nr:LacI family DNA-binding transcriptional regulator [Kiritimatiellaceae bacterium]